MQSKNPENPAEEEVIRSRQEEIFPLEKSNKVADLEFFSPAEEELFESDQNFIKQFKQRRLELGLRQTGVGLSLGSLYGDDYTLPQQSLSWKIISSLPVIYSSLNQSFKCGWRKHEVIRIYSKIRCSLKI